MEILLLMLSPWISADLPLNGGYYRNHETGLSLKVYRGFCFHATNVWGVHVPMYILEYEHTQKNVCVLRDCRRVNLSILEYIREQHA
ncbi:hypothetical protein DFS34DRAFT_285853 [Phlyctochytrium arcticum]|nr:hypothetical protein DFS34DRAFT_285853 [Phlyctochytrium arcticum]